MVPETPNPPQQVPQELASFDSYLDKGSSEDHNKWKGKARWELTDCGEYNIDHAWVDEISSAEHLEAIKNNWWRREQKEGKKPLFQIVVTFCH